MPLFECEKCHVIDNTALTNFWSTFRDANLPRLCSECDPDIASWHGIFPRTLFADFEGNRDVEYPARKNGGD